MSQPNGPVMMVLTEVLRNQRTRVGRIAGNLTLPRPVELRTLVAVAIGAFVGLLAALALNPGDTQSMFYGATLGGCAGWGAVNWSPLQGESLATWIMLSVRARGGRVSTTASAERLAIGISYLPETARGEVRIRRGAVPVPEGSVDERGVFLPLRATTLPDDVRYDLAAFRREGQSPVRLSTDDLAQAGRRSRPGSRPVRGRLASARAEAEAAAAPWREGEGG